MLGNMVEISNSPAIPGYLSRPEGDVSRPALIVFHEAFGLNEHIKTLADRLAKEGYVAMAPDLFYKSPDRIASYDESQKAMGLVASLTDELVMSVTGKAIEYLKSQSFVKSSAIGVIGWCLGGRLAFLAAANFPEDIKSAVPFYGGGITGEMPMPGFTMNPLAQADRIKAPMLLIFGDQDQFIPLDQVRRIESRLNDLGKRAEVKVYEGAGHGFFCDERPGHHAEAAEDAWRRTLAFLQNNLG